MKGKDRMLLVASAATLTLALHQGALAEPTGTVPDPQVPEQTVPATPAAYEGTDPGATPAVAPTVGSDESAPTAAEAQPIPVPAAAPPAEPQTQEAATEQSPAAIPAQPAPAMPAPPPEVTAAHERMEQRQAEMMQERKRRYDELRTRAAEVGLELPETPPWDQPGMEPPRMPALPTPPELGMPGMQVGKRGGMTPEERDAMREQRYRTMRERAAQRGVELPEIPPWQLMSDEEHQAHREKMRHMTPEKRQAMRDQQWLEMRERAREQGVEMPETPPWKQAEQRRAEMKARWESYMEILDAMTPEQKEAVQAVFGPGRSRAAAPYLGRQAPPVMPMQAPYGQQDSGLPTGPGARGFGYGPEQTMPSGPAPGWYGGDQGWYQRAPAPAADFNRGW